MDFWMEFDEGDKIEGKPNVTGYFTKKERFHDYFFTWPFKCNMWDIWITFGFNKFSDGTCEVFHTGESFQGQWPMRVILKLHAKYVIWATQKHIESAAFGDSDLIEEQEHQSIVFFFFC